MRVEQAHCFGSTAYVVWTTEARPSPAFLFNEERKAFYRQWLIEHEDQGDLFFYVDPALEALAQPHEELRIRAAQPSEADEVLRQKLGLTGEATTHIPIMQ